MKKKLILVLLAFSVLVVNPGYANWGQSSGGSFGTGNFKAIGINQVEIEKENLDITLYKDHAKVSVEYLFHNTGDKVVVKAGFPCIVLDEGYNSDKKNYREIDDYQIYVDGRRISAGFEKGSEVPWKSVADYEDEVSEPILSWFVSSVAFKKDETKTIKIIYKSSYFGGEHGVSGTSNYWADRFRYLLSTGATWKGPIKQGTVNIIAAAVNPNEISITPTERFKQNGNNFTWSFTNLEPERKDDVEVSLNNGFTLVRPPGQLDHTSWYVFNKDKYYFDFHNYQAKASSVLQGKDEYKAMNVADLSSRSAWVEGVKGDGIGESITLTLKKPIKVNQIGIIPGYTKSRELYFANNRVAEVKIVIDDTYTITKSLADEYVSFSPYSPKAYQMIDLGKYNKPVTNIVITITKVYKGSKYDDTCISEILLRKRLSERPRVSGGR
ncbi:MAG: DUF4424 family protein [Firmicutes bacterium]|nr:DUF4424 family protein [Bacillota bacterium]